jgi:polynucleotide 5'-hydroxyl-kinase GRC3/NOL9
MREERVDVGTTLIVEGEAEIEIDGTAEVFGHPLSKLSIKRGKILPVFLLEDSTVRIKGNFTPIKGSTIPESWRKLAEKDYERIFLFGESDSGKSSLATYLINRMDGRKWIIDLDIGQADVAHPAAMGLGLTDGGVTSISEVKMIDGFFVGSISPIGREARCLRGVAKLIEEVEKNLKEGDRIIVDTTGWVRGKRARNYKLAKLEMIQPDIVLCFGEVPHYLSEFNVLKVESFVFKRRSRELRSSIRSEIYSEWLKNSCIRFFNVDSVKIENTTLFKGEYIDASLLQEIIDTKVTFIEKGFDFLNVCVEEEVKVGTELIRALKGIYGVEDICFFTQQQLEGLLVGLYNERYLGTGVIKKVHLDEKKLEILTPVEDVVLRIEFGEVKLDENMREVHVRVP